MLYDGDNTAHVVLLLFSPSSSTKVIIVIIIISRYLCVIEFSNFICLLWNFFKSIKSNTLGTSQWFIQLAVIEQRGQSHYVCLYISFLCRAVGSHVVMDPYHICKKVKKLRGKMVEICNNRVLLKQIADGITLGERECEYQFRYRRWNCTSTKRSMKKVLSRGELNCLRTLHTFKLTRCFWRF